MQSYTARYVFPASGPPIANGVVVVNGDRIEAVEPAGLRKADVDFGNAAIIPGLVNPHTHLDLSGARGLIPPTDPDHFTDWLRGVIAYRRSRTAEQVQTDIRAGVEECLRFGTTLIGDIASEGASWDLLRKAKTRAIVYYELIGLDEKRVWNNFDRQGYIASWHWGPSPYGDVARLNTEYCKWGISPHAPYSVNLSVMRELLSHPVPPLATHVAESPDERHLLEGRTGPFLQFLRELGVYRADALAPEWVTFLTPLREPSQPGHHLVIHANYLPPDFPFRTDTSVVYCPRTHAAFKHPPHPFREFRRRGVRVCLGTDSLASNPDLDVLAEARFVHQRYPDFPGDELLRMVTLDGAEALGWADEAGSLDVGKSADFVVVPLPNEERSDPHVVLFADHPGERKTMFRGEMR